MNQLDGVIELVEPTSKDLPKLADTLTQAFMADPVLNWIFRQDTKKKWAMKRFFAFTLENAFEEGEIIATKNLEACAVWYPPGKGFFDSSYEALESLLPEMLKWSKKDRLGRLYEVLKLFAENRPSEPHYYLDSLGVAPKYKRMGYGTLLLKSKLASIDEEGTLSYLENSNEQNTSLYEHHGFKVIKRTWLKDSGPVLILMSRDKR